MVTGKVGKWAFKMRCIEGVFLFLFQYWHYVSFEISTDKIVECKGYTDNVYPLSAITKLESTEYW